MAKESYMHTGIKMLILSAFMIGLATPTPSYVNNCEVHGCNAYQDIYDSVGDYVISTFSGYPGNGSGSCECAGTSCEDAVQCTPTETYTVIVPNGTVSVNSATPVQQATFTLSVSTCGGWDYRSLLIDPGNGQGTEYGLVALGCNTCRDQYCPASP